MHRPIRLPVASSLTIAVLAFPVLAGVLGTLLPALGYLPALGGTQVSLAAFDALVSWPGFWPSVHLSVTVGFAATLISLAVVVLACAGLAQSRVFAVITGNLSILLSVPHAAAAFGLAFLIAPSGWVARMISPWLTGWDRPPDLLIVNDPAGLALLAGLVIKEIPFLFLMTLAALGQVRVTQSLATARALGYRPVTGWLKTVLPAVYAQIRLPVYAVLAFSMSVVDMAIILGPNTPPPLAVQVVRWMNDPDLQLRFQAAAAALVQLALVAGGLLVWRAGEILFSWIGRRVIFAGGRGSPVAEAIAVVLSGMALFMSIGAVLLGVGGLAVWSFAGLWPFPELLPDAATLRSWARYGPRLTDPVLETALIGGLTVVAALVLTVSSLEAEYRNRLAPGRGALWLLYLPLLVPQIAFIGGLQTFALVLGLDGGRSAVALAHLVFVLPYVFLTLSGPWRAWDPRYATVAHALGASRTCVLWRVRLPMLIAPVLTAGAVGFSVSVAQYLPTLLIGAGRVETLTTEAVALASGGDRRVIGIYALAQTAVALAPFVLALFIPWLLSTQKKGRAHG